ncbi:MAG: acetate--CoA ligase [Candidatus Wildermuthbacteria bacterium RIFCSPHIGHO2_01_FULL_47_27]|uniref:Acetate--CoA ligase n=1 Tax=Candidatus Wildermuthbacteria bacterium RIFCSPHIGHO2_02_FULL_47_17 TaxID=1802452 RepID=A0A1G2R4A7_9BACT|nr:MAG: acetate--CoA ligase [Candidatus Wildermuthbacteria bacterium RIFCSPHIGHO2_01_FULL_47_27]OHA67653.1 MAG: acetate--CoA ligase [Candidatus Wildermuthbacteria bacterium RIFCSPHIGHO2_02_FULL_47_17]OHA75469.1 MAG: acetate--CoA ligase [Candidatus Wildermuthbacteria bacterium RIFCSPLOWO2_02_FULL_47_10]
MIQRGNLYYTDKDFQRRALIKDASIYKEAAKDPVKFWEKLAAEIYWVKKWDKGFEHNPPYFQWFSGGKLNITENCLDRNLEQNKNKAALIWEPEPEGEKPRIITYGELYGEVNRFANALKRLGVGKGDRVGIYLPMIPEAITAMLACARIGAVHSVVFSAFSPHALQVRLQDTEAKVLVTADGYWRRGQTVSLKQNADEGIKETNVEKVIVVRRANNDINWQEQRDLWWHEIIRDENDECEAVAMDSEDLLFILYTSGSTGKPKGCVHTTGGYAVQAKFTARWIFDLKEDDIFWSTADVGWITGHTYSCYGPLLNGITFLIFEGAPDWPTPERWCQIIEKYGVTTFYTAPTAIRLFEKYGEDIPRKYSFNTLQILGSVGEPIDESAWQWYYKEVGKEKCPIVDTWWQTETGGILISSLPGVGPFRPTYTGLPFPGINVEVVDEGGKPQIALKEGSLVLLAPFAPGLLRDVYRNQQKYIDTYWSAFGDKMYFTSDAAFKDKNGLVRILGRLDDVIKVAGHRISTGEMENAINKHPEISECAVVGVPDEIKGEVPIVFVSYRGKKTNDEIKNEVIVQIKKEIGPIALPKEVYAVSDLPKTRSGKIMRRILKHLFTGEELGDLSTLSNPESIEQIKNAIKT